MIKSLKAKLIATVSIFLLITPAITNAGWDDPWWLLFRVKGGQLIQKKGPYKLQFECEADRIFLEPKFEFVACVQ